MKFKNPVIMLLGFFWVLELSSQKIKDFNYSLLIPTRNRSETAIYAIASALACKYPNLQIVVSDNSDDDQLLQLIRHHGWESLITYHKTETVLSMRDNWERAISLANGDYLSVIGDDDAVMPDAFLWANVIFSQEEFDVLTCGRANYKWPDYPFQGRQNYLSFNFNDRLFIFDNPREILRKSLLHELKMGTGPSLYYGFVKKQFLEFLRKKRGRYLVDPVPDFDSGYATLMYAKSFAQFRRPLFISGHSGKSNSGSMRFSVRQRMSVASFAKESSLAPQKLSVGGVKSNRSVIVECQIRLLEECRRVLGSPMLDIGRLGAWNYMAKEVQEAYESLSFDDSVKALADLAHEWGIVGKAEIPKKIKVSMGLVYEQGVQIYDINGDPSKTDRPPVNEKSARFTVNGNRMGFNNILDAVNYIYATLPTLQSAKKPDVREYALFLNRKRFSGLLSDAELYIKKSDWVQAQVVLETYLREDSLNAAAFASLGDVFAAQGKHERAISCFSRAMSLETRVSTLEKYVHSLAALSLHEEAHAVVAMAQKENPGNEKIKKILSALDDLTN